MDSINVLLSLFKKSVLDKWYKIVDYKYLISFLSFKPFWTNGNYRCCVRCAKSLKLNTSVLIRNFYHDFYTSLLHDKYFMLKAIHFEF